MPHNVDEVMNDIESASAEIHSNIQETLNEEMAKLRFVAMGHVQEDAHWKGNLQSSIDSDVKVFSTGRIKGTVGTDAEKAPYAPFVEFGTGSRSNDPGPTSIHSDKLNNPPAGYPYESPDFVTEDLVDGIVNWVKTKPITPDDPTDTPRELGEKIAATIVEKGTYAHPFLRPAWYKRRLHIKRGLEDAVEDAFN